VRRPRHSNLQGEKDGPGWVKFRFLTYHVTPACRIPKDNVAEEITFDVPALLPKELLDRVHAKLDANNSRPRTKQAQRYLLAGYVFCEACGFKITPSPSRTDQYRYYRHGYRFAARECKCNPRPYVRTTDLDAAVMQLLFENFGNRVGAERAIRQAVPTNARIVELQDAYDHWIAELQRIDDGRRRLMDLVFEGRIEKSEADTKIDEANSRRNLVRQELDNICRELGVQPTDEGIKEAASELMKAIRQARTNAAARRADAKSVLDDFDGMTWDDARALVERLFDPTDASAMLDGRKPGAYVSPIEGQANHKRKIWAVTIRGLARGERGCVTQSTPC
jgi:hypothetical protein